MNAILKEFLLRTVSCIMIGLCLGGAYFYSSVLFSFILLLILIQIIINEWSLLIQKEEFSLLWKGIITIIYPVMPMLSLIYLYWCYYETNMLFPSYPFLVSWTADICGYLVGTCLGKSKMCPAISPGKSWEGFTGSVVGIFVLNAIILRQFAIDPFETFSHSIFLTAVVSVAFGVVAFLGGLFISFLKRRRGVKDTGNILPGHGGLLDRFDSVFFTVIAVWLLIFLGPMVPFR